MDQTSCPPSPAFCLPQWSTGSYGWPTTRYRSWGLPLNPSAQKATSPSKPYIFSWFSFSVLVPRESISNYRQPLRAFIEGEIELDIISILKTQYHTTSWGRLSSNNFMLTLNGFRNRMKICSMPLTRCHEVAWKCFSTNFWTLPLRQKLNHQASYSHSNHMIKNNSMTDHSDSFKETSRAVLILISGGNQIGWAKSSQFQTGMKSRLVNF